MASHFVLKLPGLLQEAVQSLVAVFELAEFLTHGSAFHGENDAFPELEFMRKAVRIGGWRVGEDDGFQSVLGNLSRGLA